MELFRRLDRYFTHSDSRGSIEGLINTGCWKEVNLIHSMAGVVRGGHYHKYTEECFIIISGRIHVIFRLPLVNGPDRRETIQVKGGDVFIVNLFVEHTFEICEDAQWLNLLSVPMDTGNPDFHRYPVESS